MGLLLWGYYVNCIRWAFIYINYSIAFPHPLWSIFGIFRIIKCLQCSCAGIGFANNANNEYIQCVQLEIEIEAESQSQSHRETGRDRDKIFLQIFRNTINICMLYDTYLQYSNRSVPCSLCLSLSPLLSLYHHFHLHRAIRLSTANKHRKFNKNYESKIKRCAQFKQIDSWNVWYFRSHLFHSIYVCFNLNSEETEYNELHWTLNEIHKSLSFSKSKWLKNNCAHWNWLCGGNDTQSVYDLIQSNSSSNPNPNPDPNQTDSTYSYFTRLNYTKTCSLFYANQSVLSFVCSMVVVYASCTSIVHTFCRLNLLIKWKY